MITKVQSHEEILLGKNGEPGIAHKVGFMWRIQVWGVGLIGAGSGFLFRSIYDAITRHS